jgi:hypothetical protein
MIEYFEVYTIAASNMGIIIASHCNRRFVCIFFSYMHVSYILKKIKTECCNVVIYVITISTLFIFENKTSKLTTR